MQNWIDYLYESLLFINFIETFEFKLSSSKYVSKKILCLISKKKFKCKLNQCYTFN